MLALACASALQPALAQTKNGAKHKDWTLRCEQFKKEDGKAFEQCHMFQDWRHKERKLRILHMAVAYPPQQPDQAVAVLTMPLGIYLPLGIKIQIDKGETINVPIERCETWEGADTEGKKKIDGGCKAGIQLKEELLNSLKRGNKAFITFHDKRRTPVTVPVSLSGFTAGLRALKLTAGVR